MEINDTNKTPVKLGTTLAMAGKREEEEKSAKSVVPNNLVLSIFPGRDLLGKAFEEEGYCVVRGPDILWGGNIRYFSPPHGVFDGIIGGPPCQIFSRLKYLNPASGKKQGNLIPEFERVVLEAAPNWWLMENVEWSPIPSINGYKIKNWKLNNRWFGGIQERKRRFTFGGSDCRVPLLEEVVFMNPEKHVAVLAGHGPVRRDDKRYTPPVNEACWLQGLPENFTDELPFTMHYKRLVIGNGVPMPMARAIARAVKRQQIRI